MGNIFSKQPSQKDAIAKANAAQAGAAGPAAKLFTPEQITKVSKDYQSQALAKWNQIMSGMGAGGGTGGPDLTSTIAKQAGDLGGALGGLTQASGYGADGMKNLEAILRGVEPGISPTYSLYG